MAVTYSESLVSNPTGAQGSYPQTLTKGHEGMLGDLVIRKNSFTEWKWHLVLHKYDNTHFNVLSLLSCSEI